MAHYHHHHHHLLPLILALILLIQLPSSSHAQVGQTPALFSDSPGNLPGGQSLTEGDLTLSLFNDCGLILYEAGIPVVDFDTSTTTSGCFLSLNRYGQLVLRPSNERAPTQTVGKRGVLGDYALLFTNDALAIYGPAIWNNGVRSPTPSKRSLNAATSSNFLSSPGRVFGSENGDVAIAQNGQVSANITAKCTLSVKDDADSTIWETSPPTDDPKQCFLALMDTGMLLLQYHEGSELHTQWTGGSLREQSLYVAALRYYGRITVYGLKNYLTDHISSAPAAAAAVVAEN